ncbi:hypothetical protein TSMEX_008119 [Taenia solium]|eukprot:TsM_000705700 transcript=TsM_000705700 gene=TsM_000705700
MDLPSVSKKYITLPEASMGVHVVKLEFSNLIFVIVSTNGKLGDMVQNTLQNTIF